MKKAPEKQIFTKILNIRSKNVDTPNSELFARILFSQIALLNDNVKSTLYEGFIFTKLRISEVSRKWNPRKIFQIYSYLQGIYNLYTVYIHVSKSYWYKISIA